MKILSRYKHFTLKYINLIAAFAIIAAVGFASCQKDDFIEVLGVCPAVLYSNPVNGATNVPLDQVIRAAFNEKLRPASINRLSFTVEGAAAIDGTVTYIDSTAYFTPSTLLLPNTTYMARLTPLVTDLQGNTMQTDYVWTFSTGPTLAPVVIATSPANNAVGVLNTRNITATFSLPMDPSSITSTTFLVKQGAAVVVGTLVFAGSTATFTPGANLLSNTTYTVTLTTGAKSLSGIFLPNNYVWTFNTQAN